MLIIKQRASFNSFWISFVYVGVGTLFLLTNFNELPEFRIIQSIILLICLPVVILGFGIIWGGGEYSQLYALLAQIVVFFGFWFFIYIDLLKNYLNEQQIEDYNFIKDTFEKWSQNRDLKNKQMWHYTFKDINQNSLMKFYEKLNEYNFSLKEIRQDEDDGWILKLEIEEVLTPEKLAKRNSRFNELIIKYKISSYEGWDLANLS